MIILLSLISLICTLLVMYLLSEKFKVSRYLKVNFKGIGVGEALNVKESRMNKSTVKITFSTIKPDGLIYLNYGPRITINGPPKLEVDPYIVIYLRGGYLYTFVNSETFVDEKLSNKPISDGNKHTVELNVDTNNAKITTKVDNEEKLTHLFQSGDEALGTKVLIGYITKIRPLTSSMEFFFLPFKGWFYSFELYAENKLLLNLKDLIYGGQIQKIFYR